MLPKRAERGFSVSQWNILCVDDTEMMRIAYGRWLADIPEANVILAETNAQAEGILEHWKSKNKSIHVVIADALIGDRFSGFEILKRAKELYPLSMLVLCSSLDLLSCRDKFPGLGKEGIMPFSKDESIRTLAGIVAGRIKQLESCGELPSPQDAKDAIRRLDEYSRAARASEGELKQLHTKPGTMRVPSYGACRKLEMKLPGLEPHAQNTVRKYIDAAKKKWMPF